MLQLYITNKNYSSWSLRPWVLLKELGIEFEEILKVFAETANWESFRKFSPTGMVPCLKDGDILVWDSLAICEYLAEQHPQIWPESKSCRAWARSATAEMHSGFSTIRNICTMNCGIRVQLNEVSAGLQKELDRLDELWSQGFERFGGPYLAGDRFTAVDAFYAPVAFRIQTYGLKLSPASMSYVQRILNLPTVKSWYQSALKEPWREPGHEQEVHEVGRIIEDFRETEG